MPPTLGPTRQRRGLLRLSIEQYRDGAASELPDFVAVEEPLQIRLAGEPLATTMRTPGADVELAAGFLLSEGIIESARDLGSIAPCAGGEPGEDPDPERDAAVDVRAAAGAAFAWEPGERAALPISSACGVCGRRSIDDLLARCGVLDDPARFDPDWIEGCLQELAEHQHNFRHTGGVHAAAFWNAERQLLHVREDVGRHNAVDKVIGRLLLDQQLPGRGGTLAVSGRVGFEIAQKAVVARIPLLISVSAPSSLAVGLARSSGLTLVSFARAGRFNVYAGGPRVGPPRRP